MKEFSNTGILFTWGSWFGCNRIPVRERIWLPNAIFSLANKLGSFMAFIFNQRSKTKYLVKYFRESDRKFYKKGSFRFGTLEQYRTYEGKTQLLSDREEGKLINVIQGEAVPGSPGLFRGPDFEHRGNKFQGNTYGYFIGEEPNRPRGYAVHNELNAHVICFTCGLYSKTHHNFMAFGGINPDGSFYQGDPELVWAAQIDLRKFYEAIGAKLGTETVSWGMRVEYGERRRVLTPDELKMAEAVGVGEDEVVRAAFTKKTKYEGEMEYRILLHDSDGSLLSAGSGPLDLCCAKSRNSIVRFYKLGGG